MIVRGTRNQPRNGSLGKLTNAFLHFLHKFLAFLMTFQRFTAPLRQALYYQKIINCAKFFGKKWRKALWWCSTCLKNPLHTYFQNPNETWVCYVTIKFFPPIRLLDTNEQRHEQYRLLLFLLFTSLTGKTTTPTRFSLSQMTQIKTQRRVYVVVVPYCCLRKYASTIYSILLLLLRSAAILLLLLLGQFLNSTIECSKWDTQIILPF